MIIRQDCKFYRGDIPCSHHKREGVKCESCEYYTQISKRILIIKLGAIGDVIRTTPLVRKLKDVDPYAEITWLTYTPEIIPDVVDRVLSFDLKSILYLMATSFDIVYDLDKDIEACSLTNMINAKEKRGFVLKDSRCSPVDNHSQHKYLAGLFDDLNRANTKSYLEEIFEICGYRYSEEEYIIDRPNEDYNWGIKDKSPCIGLNTGCGARWNTRLWPGEKWIELAGLLRQSGFVVLLLGGEQEDEKNRRTAKESGATYLGFFPLRQFISLMDQCDVVVTGVTMALHIAIGLKKKVILFNNVFNKKEFELYGRGKIIEPAVDCLGCFRQNCEKKCMELIAVEEVLGECIKLFNTSVKQGELRL